ncbi:hypothetical protein [Kriegella aquimaris]|uniref:ATP synthase alpha/beta family, nucleotide-binding domain n=1 Tax=Kriegella aquimaris TaxID=192904 RepID=A0A1G9JG19_9FLAO|nr:hypothetical protein [Kriegella aquimaris]SDL36519.1 ATP synthase alpha/beta family, nucleotide-binding domain [Kriegella aquimaris]
MARDVNINNSTSIFGKVVAVQGSVVDIWFDSDLPSINTLIHTGPDNTIAIEVLSQLDDHRIRGIALTPTQGLARGMKAETDGGQLSVPVGKEIMGRMFDVFGNTIDHGEALPEMPRNSIHQLPPPLAKRSTKSEIFETGIKAIDVMVPLQHGGNAGLFGGAGVGKTVLLTEMIHNMVGYHQSLFCP